MLIKRISLENIRSYTDQTVDFPQGSTLLSGDVGSGKSTILLAIDFALFGIQKGLSGTSLLRHGANEGSVELVFDIADREYTIKRALKRKKDAVRQDAGYVLVDGMRKDLTATEAKSFIINLLGYPPEALTKNSSLIYRYTVYTPQEEMQSILVGDKEERLDIMRRVFGVDRYKRMQDNASIFTKELRGKVREIKGSLLDLPERSKMLDEAKAEKDKQAGELEVARKRVLEQTKRVEKEKRELKELQTQLESYQAKKQEYISLKSQFDRLKERKESIESALKEFQPKLEEIDKKLEAFSDLRAIDKSEAEMNAEIQREETTARGLLAKASVLSKEIESLEAILEKGMCATCGQKVADAQRFKAGIDEKSKQFQKVKQDSGVSSDRIQSLRKVKEEAQKYLSSLKEKKLLEDRKNDLLSSKELLEKESKELLESLRSITEKANVLAKELKDDETAARFKEVQSELDELEKTRGEYERQQAALEQRSRDIEARLEELASEVERKKKDKAMMEHYSKMEQWLSDFFMPLMATIERHVMANIQMEFDSLFQKWFAMIVPDENIRVRIDSDFSPLVEQNGFDTQYAFLSGGEKTAVALAYRLALNKVINDLIEKIKTKDIIILDEPTDGFSSEQMDAVRDVLQELDNRQTIIVSHEQKIDSFVDNVVRFAKEHHVSRAFE